MKSPQEINHIIAEKYPDTATTAHDPFSQTPQGYTPDSQHPRKLRLTSGELPQRPPCYSMQTRGQELRNQISEHIRSELEELRKWRAFLKS